jgi:hypothetical protein
MTDDGSWASPIVNALAGASICEVVKTHLLLASGLLSAAYCCFFVPFFHSCAAFNGTFRALLRELLVDCRRLVLDAAWPIEHFH